MSGSIEESLEDLTTTEELSLGEEFFVEEVQSQHYMQCTWPRKAMKRFYEILENVDPKPIYQLSKEAHTCNGCTATNLPGPCNYRDCIVCGVPIPVGYEKGANGSICIDCDIQFVAYWKVKD